MRRQVWADVPSRVALLAGAGWLVCYAVLTALFHGSPERARFVGDILYLVPLVATVVAAGIAARRLTGRPGRLWRLLAVAYTAQLAGEGLWAGYDYLAPGGAPEVSFADAGYLTASVFTVVAILVGFGDAGVLRHLRGLLDSLLLILSAGATGWQLLVRPQLSPSLTLGDVVTAAYPLLDLTMLCCLCIVGIGGHRRVPLSVRLVGVAGALNALSDIVYTYVVVFGEYTSGSWLDVAFEASVTCSFVAAVVAVRRREPVAERRDFDRGRAGVPVLAATASSFVLVVVERLGTGATSILTLVVVGVLFLAVLARQYLFVADRAALAAELRRAVREQERLAVTDGLTGLYNRRYLTDRMAAAERDAGPGRGGVSLLVVDLDHFKSINDTHGHPVGDVVLREAADRIAGACRATDVVARYGGEEFVVFCPDTDAAEAQALAERIRRRINGSPVVCGAAEIRVSSSIGVATRPDAVAGAVMIAADEALYRAKAAGRDRVAVAA